MARKEYYKILEIKISATITEIKKAYRDLARQSHPDKGGDVEKMKELNEAYEILRDKQKRDKYDRSEEVSIEKWGYDYGEEVPKNESAVVNYTGHFKELNRAWVEIRIFSSKGGGYYWDGIWVEVREVVSDYYLKRVENLLKVLNSHYKPQYLEAKGEGERIEVLKGFKFWDNGSGLSNEVNWNNNFNRIKKMLDNARKESFGLEEITFESLKPNIMIEGTIDIDEYNRLYYHGKHETISEFSVLREKIFGEGFFKYKAFDSTRVDEVWKELGKVETTGNFWSVWVKDVESGKIGEIKRFNQTKLEKMQEVVNLMKRLVNDEKNGEPEVKDKPVKDKKQAEVEGKVRQEFSEKNNKIGNEIQRLIHEAQGLITFEDLEVKINEIEKYREEEVYQNQTYQTKIQNLKVKLNGINEGNYKKGVVKRIEDKLRELGKKESDLTEEERNDLVKIKGGGLTSLDDIGRIENGIIARISKSNFSDVLDNLLKEANELIENVAKGTVDKLQKLRKGLYSFQFSSNIYCQEVFEEKKTEVASALNSLEGVSYSEIPAESSLFRPEVVIPVALVSLLVIGTVLVIRKVRRR